MPAWKSVFGALFLGAGSKLDELGLAFETIFSICDNILDQLFVSSKYEHRILKFYPYITSKL